MLKIVPERDLIEKLLQMQRDERRQPKPDHETMRIYRATIAQLRLQMKRKNGKPKQ